SQSLQVQTLAPLPADESKAQPTTQTPSPLARFFTSWQLWVLVATTGCIGAGVLAAALLFKLPALPNCPSIFWPTASASLRIYCAQLASNKQTVDDLLEAIALVNTLPPNHAMRPEADRYIAQWSDDILQLAEKAFHKGDLQGAIAIAERIPDNTPAFAQVEQRVQSWKETWETAEALYKQAEEALFDNDPTKAFDLAVKLLDIDNQYWKTTKYQEMVDLVTASREDGSKLAQIRRMARRGGASNLLAAIALVQEIKKTSPAYPAAQRLLNSLGKDVLNLADEYLSRRDLPGAMDLVRKIPEGARLQAEIQDFTALAQARAQAWDGSASDIEAAIAQALRIRRDRPLYGKAQQLISYWRAELQDLTHLARAQQYADLGTVSDLRAAIAELNNIPQGNPRSREARRLASRWTTDIELREDRPTLTQAEEIARAGDADSLQAAISIARQIGSGRALSAEARDRIQTWQQQLTALQAPPVVETVPVFTPRPSDPVVLDNRLPSTLRTVPAPSTSSPSAEGNPRDFASVDRSTLQLAQSAASAGTPSMLISAIQTADRIPVSSTQRPEADRLIAEWSDQVLQIAQQTAAESLEGAIAIAKGIPPRTPAYAPAQLWIEQWRQQALNANTVQFPNQ
ncbi:MAG: chromosome segregation ATPase, partial [Cyanobacteriota bacterium]